MAKRKYWYKLGYGTDENYVKSTLISYTGFIEVDSILRSPEWVAFCIHKKIRKYSKNTGLVLTNVEYGPMIPTPTTFKDKVKTFIKWGTFKGTNSK